MVSVSDLDRILAGLELPDRVHRVPLAVAVGEALAEFVEADRDIPPFDRVCMDGFALRWDEWEAGRREFALSGSSPAGAPRHAGPDPGGCIEVMTGASCPRGCDLVIRREDARTGRQGVRLEASKAFRGQNLARRGGDAPAGKILLEPGITLGPSEIAILASVGAESVAVQDRPRIQIASTGDELVDVGTSPLEHQIRRSNDQFLAAGLLSRGFQATDCVHLPDDPDLLEAGFSGMLRESDVLLVTGGVSVSSKDFVPDVLTSLGCRCLVHGVAQKPGKPLWVGIGPLGQIVFALPGNPVAGAMCFARYVLKVLVRSSVHGRTVRLDAPVASLRAMTRFVAARVRDDGLGGVVATEAGGNGSGDFLHLAGTDGFLEIAPDTDALAGSVARFWPW